jgi:SAM-dependent methyltransferase
MTPPAATPYSQGVAPFYDLFDAEPGAAADRLGFVQRLVPVGAALLEVGAGTGTLAFSLAGAGYRVTALEPDPEMHAALLTRLAPRRDLDARLTPLPVAAGHALGRHFDAVLAFAVFHLLGEPERCTLVAHAAQHLADGGALLLDVAVEGSERGERPHGLVAERHCGDLCFRKHVAMQRVGDRWRTTWELVTQRGDELLGRVTRHFDWQTSRVADVQDLLARQGLTVEQTFADASGAPFVAGMSRSWLGVARKAAA